MSATDHRTPARPPRGCCWRSVAMAGYLRLPWPSIQGVYAEPARESRTTPHPGAASRSPSTMAPTRRARPPCWRALAARGASATFFLVGEQVLRDPAPRRARSSPPATTIGLHCHRHRNLLRLTPGRCARTSRVPRAAIEDATGLSPALYRPPYGILNADRAAACQARRGDGLCCGPTGAATGTRAPRPRRSPRMSPTGWGMGLCCCSTTPTTTARPGRGGAPSPRCPACSTSSRRLDWSLSRPEVSHVSSRFRVSTGITSLACPLCRQARPIGLPAWVWPPRSAAPQGRGSRRCAIQKWVCLRARAGGLSKKPYRAPPPGWLFRANRRVPAGGARCW